MEDRHGHKIILSDGRICKILALTPSVFWVANFRMQSYNTKEYDIIPYVLEQVLLIDDKHVTIDEIDELMMEDYTSIIEIIGVYLKKIE